MVQHFTGRFHCAWVLSCSVMSSSLQPALWTVAHQAPLSMKFSRQEYWNELPFPPPRDLPNPGIKPMSPAFPTLAGRFFTTEQLGKPNQGDDITLMKGKCRVKKWDSLFTYKAKCSTIPCKRILCNLHSIMFYQERDW